MSRHVSDIIKTLSSAQRKKAEARAAQLIAEELTLQKIALRPKADEEPDGEVTTCRAKADCRD